MKFKKGDIVEVIKDDKWQGIDYPVGTQLRVCENQGRDSVVHIYDSMQKQGGCAKLWEWNLKLVKREEDENKLKFKEGQTYICTKSNLSWFTEGKEYPVLVTDFGKLAIRDDGTTWFDYELTGMTTRFKLKGVTEKPKFDLNNLTTAELREYVELVEAKEESEFLLECFIENVTK